MSLFGSRVAAVLLALFAAATLHPQWSADALMTTKHEFRARQERAAHHFARRARAPHRRISTGVKNITFANPKASGFYVDGTSIPEVDWDVGPSWSGLMPISDKEDETRKLFFWFFPPGPEGSENDLIFWTNGGPGCSSLEGFLQENGPITWSFGQAKPTVNEYSWTNLSSVLWVEQPVGTGFSQGEPNIKNNDELAEQLVGFFQQFLTVFSELKGKDLYLTGESYGGQYIPYIANYIYDHPEQLDLSLQGIWLGDPAISHDVVQAEIPALPFVKKYANVFSFNSTFMASLEATSQKCGYTNYIEKYVTYPPKGPLPLPGGTTDISDECDIWTAIIEAALEINPAFNLYRIFDVYPVLWDVLGYPGSFPAQQSPIYFDRVDVKRAIHAPLDVQWSLCSGGSDVYPDGDPDAPTALSVLPSVIERSQRTVIVHGLADYVLIAEGTRIAIQNMTWHGKQGFQSSIQADSLVVDGIGSATGSVHVERGLAYYEVALAGHMIPQFSPWTGIHSMQYLMGQRKKA